MTNISHRLRSTIFVKGLVCSLLLMLGGSIQAFALQQQTNGVTYMGWQEISTSKPLPPHPLKIAASMGAPNGGDFVALAQEREGGDAGFYVLDHEHRDLGWQKKGIFLQTEVKALQYGLNRFFAFGIDRHTKQPVVATSADNGQTWTQNIIIGGSGSYNNAVFSDQIGVATGENGAVATTSDGVTWTEVAPPSGAIKKVFCSMISPGDATHPGNYQFVLLETLPTHQCGFLTLKDFPVEPTLSSTDGTTWNYVNYFPLSPNQYLMRDSMLFLVGGSQHYSTSFTDIRKVNPSEFQPLESNNPAIPSIEVSDFTCCGAFFVSVGVEQKTGKFLSLVTSLQQYGGCNMIAIDFFSKKVMAVTGCQNGFVALNIFEHHPRPAHHGQKRFLGHEHRNPQFFP